MRRSEPAQGLTGSLVAGTMSPSSVAGDLLRAANRAACRLFGGRRLRHAAAPVRSPPKHQFNPERVAVVTKTTRYEFEQQRYRYAGLSEEDLKQLVRPPVRPPWSLSCRLSEALSVSSWP